MIYFDFEYRNNEDKDDIILLSYQVGMNGECETIDLRGTDGEKALRTVYQNNKDETWIAYNAQADLTCLLAYDLPVRDLKVIDLMAESRMITMTHPDHFSHEGTLLASLKAFGVQGSVSGYERDKLFKGSARRIILDHETYTPEQWNKIVEYGPTDVVCLPYLLSAIVDVHRDLNTGSSFNEMRLRGEYVKAVTELHFRTKGFPINEERIEDIYSRKDEIRTALAEKANELYGGVSDLGVPEDLYVFKFKNKQRVEGNWVFNSERFETLIENELEISSWERTDTGKLSLRKDYLEKRMKEIPRLLDLYRTRRTFQALSGKEENDLRRRMVDGHIRAEPFTFSQKTGRSSPKPTKGFLLNLTPWLRSALIHPHGDEVLVGIDWKNQEIGIAAALSGDVKLWEAYSSGDPYIALAIMAGAVPEDATEEKYPVVRQNFKAVQLGIGYGKGLKSLSVDIYEHSRDSDGVPTITEEEAICRAESILDWHRATFGVYWDWVSDNKLFCESDGFLSTVDGWRMFYAKGRTSPTQIQNFPMQANAASMMRQAVINVYDTHVLDLVCSLHDALYILTTRDQVSRDIKLLQGCMDGASDAILGPDWRIKKDDPDVYTSEKPYWDSRGKTQYETIARILGW